ncbi:MAG: hypothetical protein QXX72_04090 [Desulfurococcaceae archaeon]
MNITLAMQQLVAVLILVVVVVFSLFKPTRTVKIALTILLVILALVNYALLLEMSNYVEIRILPFFVVESKYIEATGRYESTFYPDFSQLSIVSLLVMWRSEIAPLVRRWFKCECLDSSSEAR